MIVPFDTITYSAKIDPHDSILSLAERLARFGGGGTNCSIPLHEANTRLRNRPFSGVVLVSDVESWVYQGQPYAHGAYGATGVMDEWQQFVKNSSELAMLCPS